MLITKNGYTKVRHDLGFTGPLTTGTPVDDKDYRVPFKFTGKTKKLIAAVDSPKLSPEDIKKLEAAMWNNRMSE